MYFLKDVCLEMLNLCPANSDQENSGVVKNIKYLAPHLLFFGPMFGELHKKLKYYTDIKAKKTS